MEETNPSPYLEVPQPPSAPLAEVLRSFAAKNIRQPWNRWLFLKAAFLWRRAFGIDQAEKKIPEEIAAGLDGYWHTDWLFRHYHYSQISASFVLPEDPERDPIRKAAQVAYGALEFRRKLRAGKVEQEFEAGKPLDMGRYHHLFSRITLSSRIGRKMVHRLTDFEPTNYFVLALEGLFYKITAYTDEGTPSYESLFSQIHASAQDAGKRLESLDVERVPIGILTTINSKKSDAVFQELRAENEKSFDLLERALFVVAVDLEQHPVSTDSILRTIHCDQYHNRDHRRSMQIVVTGNARVGIVVNPHAGIGGTLSARFCLELRKASQDLASKEPRAGHVTPQPLDFQFSRHSEWRARLDELDQEVKARIYPKHVKCTFHVDGFGKSEFTKHGLSADAVIHCALHLAFQRCYGSSPVVGNFINLRNVRYGDIWRYISTTPEMRGFLASPNHETLATAMNAHRAQVKEQKKAKDELYLILMSLKRLICRNEVSFLSAISLILLASVFVRKFARNFLNLHIWISNIPPMGGVEIAGRGSVHLDFIDKECVAGHYMIFDDHIKFCLMSSLAKGSRRYTEGRYVRTVRDCIQEIMGMYRGEKAGARPKPAEKAQATFSTTFP